MNTRFLFSTFLVFAGSGAFFALPAAERRFDVPGDALTGRVEISAVGGDVTVEAGDEPAIVLIGDEDDAPEPEPAPAGGMRSLLSGGSDNSGLGFEVKNNGSTFSIVGLRPHRDGDDVRVRMPRTMSLQIAGVIRGDVRVAGLGGDVEIATTEGDITLEAVSGPVVLNAVNGDVRVVFATFAAPRPSSINAVNGGVDVTLPADAAASLELRTINGDIRTDLPVEVTERNVLRHGGPRSVRGTLHGGGTNLKVMCVNDTIVLHGPRGVEAGAAP